MYKRQVDNLGEAGEIVEVKGGYGRNFLLPRGLAIPATRGAEKQIRDIQRVQKEREVRDLDHAKELRDQLDQLTGVKVPVRTSEKGKLFGSVKPGDIAAAVKAAGGPSLDKRRINVPKGLVTKTGGYQVKVNLHDSVEGKVNFEVVSK